MKRFEPARRNLLRLGTAGAVASLLPAAGAAAAGETRSAPAATSFNVRTYGATGDGKTVDSPSINHAIAAATAAGGGCVVFPAGMYICFSIHLASKVQLALEAGATVVAADSPLPGEQTGYRGGTYDAAESNAPWEAYQDYGHNHWHNSLLWGENLEDVSITGPGLIWGRGLSNGRDRKGDGAPFIAEQAGVGNKAIALKNCRNVLFRDFSILKGGHFGLLLTGVDNLTIDNLLIDTDRDGMDLDCCQNVRVTQCTVNSPWDDGICPKSSFALGHARPTRMLTIDSCWVTGCYQLGSVLDGSFRKFDSSARVPQIGRIKCGTESNGGFINIAIANCIFEGCQGLALESVDGALLEDIAITNLTMRDLVTAPFFFRLGARLRGPAATTRPGTLRRIMVSNVTSYNCAASACSFLSGIPDHPIEDVKFSNLYMESIGGGNAAMAAQRPPEQADGYPDPGRFGVMPAYGFFLRHVRGLEMSHVETAAAAPDARPAFWLADVDHADFFAITAQRAPAGPAFALHDVSNMRIGWSRAAKDTTIHSTSQQTV